MSKLSNYFYPLVQFGYIDAIEEADYKDGSKKIILHFTKAPPVLPQWLYIDDVQLQLEKSEDNYAVYYISPEEAEDFDEDEEDTWYLDEIEEW